MENKSLCPPKDKFKLLHQRYALKAFYKENSLFYLAVTQ